MVKLLNSKCIHSRKHGDPLLIEVPVLPTCNDIVVGSIADVARDLIFPDGWSHICDNIENHSLACG